jgi:signal transduction histidine kinase
MGTSQLRSNTQQGQVVESLIVQVADLKHKEAALAAQQELLENLLQVAHSSPEASMLEATLQTMLDVSTRLTGAERGSLFVLDQNGAVTDSILTRADASTEQRHAIIGTVMEQGLAGWVARHLQVGLILDTLHDDRWVTLPHQPYAFRSALAVPILRAEQLLGVIHLLHAQPGYFHHEHARLMQVTADQMALALDNARLHNAAQQEIAERRRAEAALQEANSELAAAKMQIEQWMGARTKETMAAVHDIRHGVRDIMISLEMLALDLIDTNVPALVFKPGVQRTQSALDALLALLNDMQDAAMLQSNALVLHPEPTDLRALVTQVVQRLKPHYDLLDCALTVTASDTLPLVWCDARRMVRVLYNVLHNAATYTAAWEDNPTRGAVRVELSSIGNDIICRTIDNGPGIAPEQLKRLGQRFARVAGGGSTPEGSGLGLNFCIGIMTLQGGSFELTSPGLGHGTTVILRLSVAAGQERKVHHDTTLAV